MGRSCIYRIDDDVLDTLAVPRVLRISSVVSRRVSVTEVKLVSTGKRASGLPHMLHRVDGHPEVRYSSTQT